MKIYQSYLFRTKDPIIDEMRTVYQEALGGVRSKHLRQVERDGGATASAQMQWFHGKTRRPQNASIEASLRAMGKCRKIVDLPRDEFAKIEKRLARLRKGTNGKG
jgi:hypothetical protein